MINRFKPLQKGDWVAVLATAKKFDAAKVREGIEILKSWGLNVWYPASLFDQEEVFAGSDFQRTIALQEAINNDFIKAIFCVRGGYGTGRIIDDIDFSALEQYPKYIIGFSDVTYLLSKWSQMGMCAIHAPMIAQFSNSSYRLSIEALRKVIFEKSVSYPLEPSLFNKQGASHGVLVGGNLSILHNDFDSQSEFDYEGKILFIEEISEHHYHLDRMMVHFKRSGRLAKIKGLIVGYFTDLKDKPEDFGKNYQEIILDACKTYDFPIVFDFPAGHDYPHLPLLMGQDIYITVENNFASISYINPYQSTLA
jgi:muramoyltetrapeptide carboxypeptidase